MTRESLLEEFKKSHDELDYIMMSTKSAMSPPMRHRGMNILQYVMGIQTMLEGDENYGGERIDNLLRKIIDQMNEYSRDLKYEYLSVHRKKKSLKPKTKRCKCKK
jgi:hypothetical protein